MAAWSAWAEELRSLRLCTASAGRQGAGHQGEGHRGGGLLRASPLALGGSGAQCCLLNEGISSRWAGEVFSVGKVVECRVFR